MKYLAILRDSFREAIDSKVIYALIPLSLLVTLFVLSISFTPGPADTAMKFTLEELPFQLRIMRLQEQKKSGEDPEKHLGIDDMDEFVYQLKVHKIELVDGQPDSPASTYRVTLGRGKRPFGGPPDMNNPQPATPEVALKFVKQQLGTLDRLKVFKVKDLQPVAAPERDPDQPQKAVDPQFTVTLEPADATRRMWPHEIGVLFGVLPIPPSSGLGFTLNSLSYYILLLGSMVTMLVSVIITAFFIPNMLRKGTVDLLIVKPIHRWVLLVYKYIGGLTFVLINTSVAMLGIWLAFGLRSGIWANGFLVMILVYTFFFAILYSVSTLFAVMTRSAIVAMMATCAVWAFLFILSLAIWIIDLGEKAGGPSPPPTYWTNHWVVKTIRAVHFVMPRTSDIDAQGRVFLEDDFKTEPITRETTLVVSKVTWGENLAVSLAFIVIMLGLSCWWFSTKDY